MISPLSVRHLTVANAEQVCFEDIVWVCFERELQCFVGRSSLITDWSCNMVYLLEEFEKQSFWLRIFRFRSLMVMRLAWLFATTPNIVTFSYGEASLQDGVLVFLIIILKTQWRYM